MQEEKVTSQFYEPAAAVTANEKNQYCKTRPDSEGVRVEFPTKDFWQCPRIHLYIYRLVHSLFTLVFFFLGGGGLQNFQICFSNSGHGVEVEAYILHTGGPVPSNIGDRIQRKKTSEPR